MIGTLISDMAKYLPSRVIPAAAGILAIPIITRILPPSRYGNYTLIITVVLFLSNINGWTSNAVLRFFPMYEKKGDQGRFTATTTALLACVTAILSVLALFMFFCTGKPVLEIRIPLFLAGIALFAVGTFYDFTLSFLRIQRKVLLYSFFYSWKTAGGVIAGLVILVFWVHDEVGLVLGMVAVTVLALPFALMQLPVPKKNSTRLLDSSEIREFARYAFPLVAAELAMWALYFSDRFILQFFRGAAEVGIYSLGWQIAERSIMMLIQIFNTSFNPLSVRLWENKGSAATSQFLASSTRIYLYLCVPAVLGLSTLSDAIIRLFAPASYNGGARIIPLICISVFICGLTNRFGAVLGLSKKTGWLMGAIIIASTYSILINILLIPRFGIMGAAIANISANILNLVLVVWRSRKGLMWPFPWFALWVSLGSSLILAFLCKFILFGIFQKPLPLILSTVAFFCLFYIPIVFFYEFRSNRSGVIQILRMAGFSGTREKQ